MFNSSSLRFSCLSGSIALLVSLGSGFCPSATAADGVAQSEICNTMTKSDFSKMRHTICTVETVPSNFPTVGPGMFDPDCDGSPELVSGTGLFISSSTVLTNAHNLFHRRSSPCSSSFNFMFFGNSGSSFVTPASMPLAGTNQILRPFGQYRSQGRIVPIKYMDPGAKPFRRDIGLIFLDRQFTGGRTFLTMQFGKAKRVEVSGYSSHFSPSPAIAPFLHGTEGDVSVRSNRYQHYWIDTKKGISGSPQVEVTSRRVVGVHNAQTPFCAGGPWWGGKNVDLIKSALQLAMLNDAATTSTMVSRHPGDLGNLPWEIVREMTLSDQEILIELDELRVIDPEVDNQVDMARECMQIIQGEFYHWEEYDLIPNDDQSPQFVRMIEPMEYWMPAPEAQALLSAARNWGEKYNVDPLAIEPESTGFVEPGYSPEIILDEIPQDEVEDEEPEEWFEESQDDQVPGDINQDNVVDASDLGSMLANWGQSGATDINLDGLTDSADLGMLLANWTTDLNQ